MLKLRVLTFLLICPFYILFSFISFSFFNFFSPPPFFLNSGGGGSWGAAPFAPLPRNKWWGWDIASPLLFFLKVEGEEGKGELTFPSLFPTNQGQP